MEERQTSLFENGLIWFGAGVSLAEILTGTYFATLGFRRGVAAILLGHLIGCVLLFLAGYIGGKTGKSAMETVKLSFGGQGASGTPLGHLSPICLAGPTRVGLLNAAPAGRLVAGYGDADGGAVAEGQRLLDESLAEGAAAH